MRIPSVRILALFMLFLISFTAVAWFLVPQRGGVKVLKMEPWARCSNVEVGFVVNEVDGREVRTPQEFYTLVSNHSAGDYVPMVVNGVPGGCFVTERGMGIKVGEISSKRIRLSSEVGGSIVKKYAVEGNPPSVDYVVKILRERANILGLGWVKIRGEGSEISFSDVENPEVLFSPCRFSVRVVIPYQISNGSSMIFLGDKPFNVRFINESTFELDGKVYGVGEKFFLDGTEVFLTNATNASFLLNSEVVGNEDVLSNLVSEGNFYVFYSRRTGKYQLFALLPISNSSEEKILKLLKNVDSYSLDGRLYLYASFSYTVDNNSLGSFPVYHELKESCKSVPVAVVCETYGECSEIKKTLMACLKTGEFPYQLRYVGEEYRPPTHKNLAIFLAALPPVISFLPFLKRKGKRTVLLSSILLAEIFILFGIALLTQIFFNPGMVIDLVFLASLAVPPLLTFFELSGRGASISRVKILLLIASFPLFFTPFKNLGFVCVFWLALRHALTENFLKTFL